MCIDYDEGVIRLSSALRLASFLFSCTIFFLINFIVNVSNLARNWWLGMHDGLRLPSSMYSGRDIINPSFDSRSFSRGQVSRYHYDHYCIMPQCLILPWIILRRDSDTMGEVGEGTSLCSSSCVYTKIAKGKNYTQRYQLHGAADLYRLLIGEVHRTIEMTVIPVRGSHRARSEPRLVEDSFHPSPGHKPSPHTHCDIASHLTGFEACFSTRALKHPRKRKNARLMVLGLWKMMH